MAKTIIALYEDFTVLRALMQDLQEAGIGPEAVSLVAHDAEGYFARDTGMDPGEGRSPGLASRRHFVPRTGGGGMALPDFGSITIPGVGRVVAGGAIASLLRGAPDPDRGGGLQNALVAVGVPDDHARMCVDGLRRGGMLVMVQPSESEAELIADILNRHRPLDLNEREEARRAENNWQGFDGDAEPFAFNEQPQPRKKRAATSRLDYGPGASEFIEGQPVSDYDRKQADMGKYTGEQADNWHLYESRYRAHFEQRYAESGKRWEDYRDAYRFGFDLAHMTPQMNQPWEVVREYAVQNWSTRNMGKDWAEYEDAVQAGWEAAHVPH